MFEPPLKKKVTPQTSSFNIRKAALYSGLGIQMIASFLVCFALGQFADKNWDTEPWFTLLSVVVGFLVAGLGVYAIVKKDSNE